MAEQALTQLIASYPTRAFRRPKLRFRLHPALFPSSDETTHNRLRTLLGDVVAAVQHEHQDAWPVVCQLLRVLRGQLQGAEHICAIDALLQVDDPQIHPYPQRGGVVIVAAVSISLADARSTSMEDLDADEAMEHETSLVLKGRPVMLSVHTDAVEQVSVEFAKRSGLHQEWAEQLTEAVRIAARWHDQGKRDRRFQAWLHGSEIEALAALASDRPLAKSGRDPKQ